MIVVDTCVLARVVFKDDERQLAGAVALLRSGMELYVPRSVVQELGWLLHRHPDFDRPATVFALATMVSLSGVVVEDRDGVHVAIRLYDGGFDWGDALLVAAMPEPATVLATFDRKFIRRFREAAEDADVDRLMAMTPGDIVAGIEE